MRRECLGVEAQARAWGFGGAHVAVDNDLRFLEVRVQREGVFLEAEEQSTFRAGEFVAKDLGLLAPNPPQVTEGEVVAYKAE